MGALRFLLALSVAYGHLGAFLGFPLVPGDTAVQCFFIVSGFYMSLVLNGKYEHAGYWLFLSNRLLRLYPVYLAVFAATVLLATPPRPRLDALGWLYFAVSQLTLFGQDAVMFLAIKSGALAFTSNFNQSSGNLFEFSVVPQAWTLGVELWFYLLAPLVLRRSPAVIVGLFVGSIVLRMVLQLWFGLSGDPWSYRFFPSELALFLLGAIAHRLDRKSLIVAAVTVAVVLFINRAGGPGRLASVSFLAAAAVSIPWLFAKTQCIEADKFLGELSYPIYLVHILAGSLIAGAVPAFLATLAAAVAIYLLVDRPIDRWRQSRLTRAAPALA